MLSELQELRQRLGPIDEQVFTLLDERNSITDRIGRVKTELGLPTEIPEVEQANTERLKRTYDEETVQEVYPAILKVSKDRQRRYES